MHIHIHVQNSTELLGLSPSYLFGLECFSQTIPDQHADILFDNIYIGHSVEDANKFKVETFDVKKPLETEQAKPKPNTKHVDDEEEVDVDAAAEGGPELAAPGSDSELEYAQAHGISASSRRKVCCLYYMNNYL